MKNTHSIKVTTNPTAEPLSLDETKTFLRVDHSEEDDFILGLIVAAREYCEAVTKRSFVTQTMRARWDDWPDGDALEVPRPFQSTTAYVPALKYYASGSTSAVAVSAATYWIDNDSEPGRLVLRDNQEWPTTALRSAQGVELVFTSGYGGEADVPDGILHAMRLLVGSWYNNRENEVVGTITASLEIAVQALLSPHVVPYIP